MNVEHGRSRRYICTNCRYTVANDGAPKHVCPRCTANVWEAECRPAQVAPEGASLSVEDVRQIVREELAATRAAERAVNAGRSHPRW